MPGFALFFARFRLDVHHQAVTHNVIAVLASHFSLQALDVGADKLNHFAGFDIHHVVVMIAAHQFEHRMSALEMVAVHQTRSLELGQHAIDGGEADVVVGIYQHFVDVFGGHVPRGIFFEDFDDFQAWQRDFQASAAQVLRFHVRYYARPMRALLIFAIVSGLAGCADWFEPLAYKLPTRQGNVLEQKQLDQLRLGMTQDQVKFLLGTPLAASPFREDRWDYVGYYKSPRGQVSSRTVSLIFEKGQIARMEGVQLAKSERAEAQRLETPDVQNVINTDKKDRLEDERAKQTEAPRPTTGESTTQK